MRMNYIYNNDALKALKELESESVDSVVTSPPYWSLRDYGMKGQLGLEPTFEEYINSLCIIFDEVKRVLKKTGTCWVNLGDTYAGSGNGQNDYRTDKSRSIQGKGKYSDKRYQGLGSAKLGAKGIYHETTRVRHPTNGLPKKSLCMIPFRFAIEMVERGWILRNTIIWHKPNCMPQSMKDRFTVDFEYVFFFVKNKEYFFNQLFDTASSKENSYRNKLRQDKNYDVKYEGYKNNFPIPKANGLRNKRTTWSIPTQPFKDSHFATFPEKLVETPILAGSPMGG